MKQSSLIPVERIERAIYLIRGEKVMLDRDVLLVCCRGITDERGNSGDITNCDILESEILKTGYSIHRTGRRDVGEHTAQ